MCCLATIHFVTDRRTDGQTERRHNDAYSRLGLLRIAVRPAKNLLGECYYLLELTVGLTAANIIE